MLSLFSWNILESSRELLLAGRERSGGRGWALYDHSPADSWAAGSFVPDQVLLQGFCFCEESESCDEKLHMHMFSKESVLPCASLYRRHWLKIAAATSCLSVGRTHSQLHLSSSGYPLQELQSWQPHRQPHVDSFRLHSFNFSFFQFQLLIKILPWWQFSGRHRTPLMAAWHIGRNLTRKFTFTRWQLYYFIIFFFLYSEAYSVVPYSSCVRTAKVHSANSMYCNVMKKECNAHFCL